MNSLWFWGGGVSPDHVTTPHALVQSNEVTLRALAKAAKVGPFMAVMVTDTYDEQQQGIFRDGMRKLNEAGFMTKTPAERLALLEQLDREAKAYMDTRARGAPTHYFRQMKELTLLGYFTSEIGCSQAMRYRETPGRFDPCVPYTPGETAWAGHA